MVYSHGLLCLVAVLKRKCFQPATFDMCAACSTVAEMAKLEESQVLAPREIIFVRYGTPVARASFHVVLPAGATWTPPGLGFQCLPVTCLCAGKHRAGRFGWLCNATVADSTEGGVERVCKHENWQPHDFFLQQTDAWPLTPMDDGRGKVFVHMSVLERWRQVQFNFRAASVQKFLKVLEADGYAYGNQVRSATKHTPIRVHRMPPSRSMSCKCRTCSCSSPGYGR